jgi:hypothetical protein
MKKIFIPLIFEAIFFISGFGQDKRKTEPLPAFSMGVEAAFPIGDFNALSSMGAGMKMQTVTPFCSMAAVSFSAGVTNYFITTKAKIANIKNFFAFPVEGGCRLFSARGLYLEPKAGFTFFSGKSNNDMAFTYALNLGIRTGNFIDFSFGYESAQLSGLALAHAGINIAYIFH